MNTAPPQTLQVGECAMSEQIKQINVKELAHMSADQLQEVQANVVNRMIEITQRRAELAANVQEDEGLKAETNALKSIKDGVKSMMENLPK